MHKMNDLQLSVNIKLLAGRDKYSTKVKGIHLTGEAEGKTQTADAVCAAGLQQLGETIDIRL